MTPWTVAPRRLCPGDFPQGRSKRLKFFYKQEAGVTGERASVLFPERPHMVLLRMHVIYPGDRDGKGYFYK